MIMGWNKRDCFSCPMNKLKATFFPTMSRNGLTCASRKTEVRSEFAWIGSIVRRSNLPTGVAVILISSIKEFLMVFWQCDSINFYPTICLVWESSSSSGWPSARRQTTWPWTATKKLFDGACCKITNVSVKHAVKVLGKRNFDCFCLRIQKDRGILLTVNVWSGFHSTHSFCLEVNDLEREFFMRAMIKFILRVNTNLEIWLKNPGCLVSKWQNQR